jgi:hypothetical protein
VHDFAIHIREPEVAASVAVGKQFEVDAERMEQSGMQVVDGSSQIVSAALRGA